MTRKFTLALAAAVALGAAALAPTAASAHWYHGHHGHWGHGWGWGFGYVGPSYVADADCYIVRRAVELPDGSVRVRRFRVCD